MMRQRLRAALQGKVADWLEIRFEEEDITTFALSAKEVNEISQVRNRVGNVRALVNGGWGFVAFNDVERLDEWVERAIAQARLAAGKPRSLAQVEPVVDTRRAVLDGDPREISMADKLAMVRRYADLAIGAHPFIVNVLSTYQDIFQRRYYVNSDGADIEQEKCYLSAGFSVVARHKGVLETYGTSFRSVSGYNDLLGRDDEIRLAVERVVEMVQADVVPAGVYTVVLDPSMSGLFIHEAFGHLSESDGIYENEQLKQVMTLGTRFGSPILTVSDGAATPGLHGSYHYDDEGTPAGKIYLIKEGILTGRLHSRETAGTMGEPVTGNARAINYQYPPIVRMTNTCIEPGESKFEDMIKDVPLGLYIRGTRGGTTMKEMFTFAAQEAFMIRDGQIAERVRGVVMMGNLFETLRNIDAVGDDFVWRFGTCGKGGQAMIPAGMGGPSVRIRNVVVGGK
jgi:TldD protein